MNARFAIVVGEWREAVVQRLRETDLAQLTIGDVDVFTDCHLEKLTDARGQCLVLGHLFRRSDYSRLRELSVGLGHAIGDSGGQCLIDRYWGGYIVVSGGEGRYSPFLLRDPSAQLPLYRWSLEGCDLYFNDFSLACDASGQNPVCDWSAVAHRLRFPALRIAETGLIGITEVLPGARVALATGEVEQLWKPWDFAVGSGAAHDPAALAETIDACTRAWIGVFDRIEVELSGGLDSSIVVASAAASDGDWRCVTYATDAPAGDERAYARAVAEMFDVRLEERVLSADDLDALTIPSLRVRPGGFGVFSAIDRTLAQLAREAGSDAIFSGGGGDNIFCKIRSAGPVVDALMLNGLRTARRVSSDLATLCETGLWDVVSHALRQWRRRAHWSWPATDALLTHAARVPCRGHPWLELGARPLPGKRAHIAALVGVLPFLDGYDRARTFPMIFPLLSQPVVEHCLAIPSWRWIHGGRDRAFAREAFSERLPETIIRRRSKGGLRSIMVPTFERSREALAALLCEGRLAEQGLIDLSAMRVVFQSPLRPDSGDYIRIFELADIELWVRSIERLGRSHRG